MKVDSHILNNFQSSIEDLEVDLQKMTELTINNLKASINGLIQRDSAACSSVIASDDEIIKKTTKKINPNKKKGKKEKEGESERERKNERKKKSTCWHNVRG